MAIWTHPATDTRQYENLGPRSRGQKGEGRGRRLLGWLDGLNRPAFAAVERDLELAKVNAILISGHAL